MLKVEVLEQGHLVNEWRRQLPDAARYHVASLLARREEPNAEEAAAALINSALLGESQAPEIRMRGNAAPAAIWDATNDACVIVYADSEGNALAAARDSIAELSRQIDTIRNSHRLPLAANAMGETLDDLARALNALERSL